MTNKTATTGTGVTIMKATPGLTPAKVKEITILAEKQIKLEDELADLTLKADLKAKELYKMKTMTLPLALQAARVTMLQLEGSGHIIEVANFVTGHIKEVNRAAAFAWLRKNKLDSIIKRTIDIAFGMGEDKKAAAIAKLLTSKRVPFESAESVHANTLRAFVRERLEEGKALPSSIDVTSVPTVSIKRSK